MTDKETIAKLEAEIANLKEALRHYKNCPPPHPPKKYSVLDLKDIRDAALAEMNRLENCHSRVTPHGMVWEDEYARKEYLELKKKVRQINLQIAKL